MSDSEDELPKDEKSLNLDFNEPFFDKDHIVFYIDDEGEVKCSYSLFDTNLFQDLILSILSGVINEPVLYYLYEDFDEKGLKEEALLIVMIKKLLKPDEQNPIIKPSNFK